VVLWLLKIEDYGLSSESVVIITICTHFSTIVEVFGEDVLYQEDWRYPEAMTKGGITINPGFQSKNEL